MRNGPDGSPGSVITYTPTFGTESKLACEPENQRWVDFGDFWLGYWTGEEPQCSRPTPADLQKTSPFATYNILLGDGNMWAVPIVPVDLPKTFTIGKDGKAFMRVKRDFLDLIPLARKYLDVRLYAQPLVKELEEIAKGFADATGEVKAQLERDQERITALLNEKTPSHTEMGEDLVKVLSKSYHISRYEIAALELFDLDRMVHVIDVCIRDEKALIETEEALKKSGDYPLVSSAT